MAEKVDMVETGSTPSASPPCTFETKKPTEVEDQPWIYAYNRTDRNSRRPPDYSNDETKCGKWMIFEDGSRIDEIWKTVSQAVIRGDLGHTAKVSTMMDKEMGGWDGLADVSFVICVYTYDWTDETDVFRVREGLRDLGFKNVLRYKTDADTLAGNYAGEGKRVSKYTS